MVKSNTEVRPVSDEEHDAAEAFAYAILSLMNDGKVEPVAAMTGLAIASVQFCLNIDRPVAALADLQSVQNQYMASMGRSINEGKTTRSDPGRKKRTH